MTKTNNGLLVKTYNKRLVWNEVIQRIEEEAGFEVLNIVQRHAYLDSIENNTAILGFKSYTWMEIFQNKHLVPLVQGILSNLLNAKIQVKLALGRPRFIESKPKQAIQQCGECFKAYRDCVCEYGPHPNKQAVSSPVKWTDPELGALHEQYGDIMGIVDNDPIFVQATTAIEKGGWGIFHQILTNACKDYGVLTVRNGLRDVASKPHIIRPRAYFLDNLKAGIYGYKLARGASIIGPIAGC
jgi:hypothetical protein